ncbi:MAG: hydantoinase B/oxoprolinase family protein [Fuerstiella sp.]
MSSSDRQFWIDVGGTFTDCIGVSPDGQISQFKTLSSGVCKGIAADFDGATITDELRTHDPPDFWIGADCRLLSADGTVLGTTRIAAFDASTGKMALSTANLVSAEPPVSDVPISDVPISRVVGYELDARLPAPVLAIRWLLRLQPGAVCPAVRVRFGTTRGTNALLTRTGARTALLTTRGFADVPQIGNQDRPDLFQLNIQKPEPLFSRVFEISERIAPSGEILQPLDTVGEAERLVAAGLTPDRFDSVAICLLHAWRQPAHEIALADLVAELGFSEISRSSEVSPLIRFVPRCDTTVLDAYLNPVLRLYLDRIRAQLPGSDVQVMTSVGGLVDSHAFRGRDCILSGPAGGIVGFSKVAAAEDCHRAIGFDMGGTSTDVARFDGQFEFENETTRAGVRIMTPVLAIETVAAGGGSICSFDGVRLAVGPDSAGADPGPACYGSGGPLTVTDLNVYLGRVLPAHFPFPLNTDAVHHRLQELRDDMAKAGIAAADADLKQLAEGLLQIANDSMVQAIRRVSVAKGYHPADYALVSFGGAGGQHACSIARSLGIRTVLIHPMAGILSAYGMGHADVRAIRQTSVLQPLSEATLSSLTSLRRQLEHETNQELLAQHVTPEQISAPVMSLELRYRGTDSSLMVVESSELSFRAAFEQQHRRLFGFVRPDKDIEIAALRVETVGTAHVSQKDSDESREAASAAQTQPEMKDDSQVSPDVPSESAVWVHGQTCTATVLQRDALTPGRQISGPCVICEPTSTVFVEPECRAVISKTGTICITVDTTPEHPALPDVAADSTNAGPEADPVLLEVFNNQFVSIAEQMGETLRRTSTSTNVRERLDYSCALFDSAGRLVVNAPHVPVHLGAMGETVRAVIADHPRMQPGDVYVTNDPYRGGSHLPDITVVTPVFCDDDAASTSTPAFYVANRAHHAEIGGIAPGSMPPFSKNLAQEGVLITSRKLVDGGVSCEQQLHEILTSGPFPSRAVNDNLADLAAQTAANECGLRLLIQLSERHTRHMVQQYMQHIQTAAARKMRLCLSRLPDRTYRFRDQLDDGSAICVHINVQADHATVDFTGTAGVHPQNLNANRAITTAAVLYSFRCLLNEDVPLNAGVLEPLHIVIPEGLLNPPPGQTPESSPAMVGGNVETSQRIVDVLLGALQLAAASQGTMNNLTFGDGSFGYYETICGGAGATATSDGADAVHTHMTNTRLTDPEVLEQRYPVRLREFRIRKGSGGAGQFRGGDGIVRDLEFLRPLTVSMLSQRRRTAAPYGLHGGTSGAFGNNCLSRVSADTPQILDGSFSVDVVAGDQLIIKTPGGGGFGSAAECG